MGELIVGTSGALGRIRICNPDRHNAMTLDMWQHLPRALAELEADASVRAILIEGEGPKAFVSGSDVSRFGAERSDAAATQRYNRAVEAAMLAPRRCGKPVLAKIRGICMGGGMGIAAACDIRICSDEARFGIPAARLGLGYAMAPLRRLVQLMGEQNACDVLYSGRTFGAAEALAMGFVARTARPEDLDEVCRAWLDRVAENAPLTLKAIKLSMAELEKEPQARDLAAVESAVADCFESQDYREGAKAFMEKRKPVFTGR